MSKQTKTTAATCAASTKATTEPITYADNGKAVTITVQSAAYANLQKLASAMNAVAWCDSDNTPTSILENFIVGYGLLDKLSRKTEKYGDHTIVGGVGEIAEDICEAIDTGFDDEGSPEANKRIEELRLAFEAAGLYA